MNPICPDEVRVAVASITNTAIRSLRSVPGGDINDAHRVELTDGTCVFVKTNRTAPHALFQTEAQGLSWLAKANALRIPEVLGVGDGPHSFLVLEYMPPGPRANDYDARLGRGLAQLHQAGAPGFGLDHDNFIGRLPQSNRHHDRWSDFYRSERLAPLLRTATDAGLTTSTLRSGFERLFSRIDERVGPIEPPARLHGDLWAGNVHVAADGAPVLIDPAVYGGHREVDLAMLQLFGTTSPAFLGAYHETYPLEPGWRQRVPLYQLYPLLVHLILFGTAYASQLERALAET